MQLVLGLNLHRFKSINPANRSSRINQLFCVLKGNPVTWVHLNSGQWGKLIYPDSLLDPEGLVFRGDGTGHNPESRISFGSRCYGLS
jgi:hypothetical protein